MKSNQQNFHPLRFIRIAKDIKQNEFSKYFSCSPAYISSVENGKRKMTLRILKSGLNELGISLEDYFELEELGNYLVTSETEKEIIYRCMLAKSIGIIVTISFVGSFSFIAFCSTFMISFPLTTSLTLTSPLIILNSAK